MEFSLSYYHILSVISSFLSISLGSFLLFSKHNRNKSNRYLGALLWVYSLFFLPGFFETLGILEEMHFIIRANTLAGTLIGPLTYFYCKSSTQKRFFLFKNIYYHFIPSLFNFIYFIPTLLKSKEEKIAIYREVLRSGLVPDPLFLFALKIFLTLSYTILSIKVVYKYLNHLKNTSSSIDTSFYKWLLFLSSFLLFSILTSFIISITNINNITAPTIVLFLASFIFIIYFTLTNQPKFFHHFPHKISSPEEKEKGVLKYKHSNLQESQKDIYQAKILAYMEAKKPFLDLELTINSLSEQLNIPSYYMSQLINERLECNFLDFVNQYRVTEAQQMLKNPRLHHYTIMGIAHEAGFNSKTAFYSAFKKNTEFTPSEFRKRHTLVSA